MRDPVADQGHRELSLSYGARQPQLECSASHARKHYTPGLDARRDPLVRGYDEALGAGSRGAQVDHQIAERSGWQIESQHHTPGDRLHGERCNVLSAYDAGMLAAVGRSRARERTGQL